MNELWYHYNAWRTGTEDFEFGFHRRMQVCPVRRYANQACVKRRAMMSLQAHPLKPTKDEAERLVNEVFPSCFRDTRCVYIFTVNIRPFDELY
jgi:Peptidase M76 family